MLAPGLPDLLFADGQRLGWIGREGVFTQDGETVRLRALPGIHAISICESAWVTVTGSAPKWTVTRLP